MSRPITLFTGQWADLPLEVVAEKAAAWGYEGLELACWGDHFEVDRALAEDDYCRDLRATLDSYGLACWTISNHLVGQAVCDHPIDERHRRILPARIWGDGAPEGVRQRAALDAKVEALVSSAVTMSAGEYVVRARAGGFSGKGCVGEYHSPGTSAPGTRRSSTS